MPLRCLTSRHNPLFKSLRDLTDDPRRHGQTLLDGIHLVAACLDRAVPVRRLVVSESGQRHPEVAALLHRATGVECVMLGDALFRELSGVATPIGVAAVIDIPAPLAGELDGDAVLLDAVQDAGNVGALLRSAAAAGIRHVVLGRGCAGAWTPRVLRAAQGAHFSLEIREQAALDGILPACGGTTVATVAGDAASLYALDLRGPVAWLFGNEGAGLSPELVAAARLRATIPLAPGSESLNVAAAAAVCLFEARRQRLAP